MSYQKEFTIQRLAGQVLILKYKGSSPLDVTVKVISAPGQSAGHIQLNAFKRVGGILQPPGDVEEGSDSVTKEGVYRRAAAIFMISICSWSTPRGRRMIIKSPLS
jgi:hypothetical protein